MEVMSRMMPNIRQQVAPITYVTHDLQSILGGINLRKMPSSDDGIWQNSVSFNAMTNKFSIEQDCFYTFINVPAQKN